MCTCGNPEPHTIASRTTADGIAVYAWHDGAITGGMGRALPGVPVARPRTDDAINESRRAAALFIGEVCLYDLDECADLYAACRWAAKRNGLPGDVRKRLRAMRQRTIAPVWTVTRTDARGNVTEREWLPSRLQFPGVGIVDHMHGDRYEVFAIRDARGHGGIDKTAYPTGFKFSTLEALAAHLHAAAKAL